MAEKQNGVAVKQDTTIAKATKPVDVLKGVLNAESVRTQFTNALGKSAPAFIASVIDLFNTDSHLLSDLFTGRLTTVLLQELS